MALIIAIVLCIVLLISLLTAGNPTKEEKSYRWSYANGALAWVDYYPEEDTSILEVPPDWENTCGYRRGFRPGLYVVDGFPSTFVFRYRGRPAYLEVFQNELRLRWGRYSDQ